MSRDVIEPILDERVTYIFILRSNKVYTGAGGGAGAGSGTPAAAGGGGGSAATASGGW